MNGLILKCKCGEDWDFHSEKTGACGLCLCTQYDGPQPILNNKIAFRMSDDVVRIYSYDEWKIASEKYYSSKEKS